MKMTLLFLFLLCSSPVTAQCLLRLPPVITLRRVANEQAFEIVVDADEELWVSTVEMTVQGTGLRGSVRVTGPRTDRDLPARPRDGGYLRVRAYVGTRLERGRSVFRFAYAARANITHAALDPDSLLWSPDADSPALQAVPGDPARWGEPRRIPNRRPRRLPRRGRSL